MYESPINQILGEMQITYENECMKAVQSCGFDVNKEELTRALMYDRGQYEKGYSDGYVGAIDNFLMQMQAEIDSSAKFIREYDDSIAQKAYYSGLCHALKIAEEFKTECER